MITKSEITIVKSLADKRSRDELSLFVAEGAKLVGEILDSSLRTEVVYATAKGAALLGTHAPKVTIVSDKEIERMSHLKTPSAVVALVHKPQVATTTPTADRLTLVLDRVQDPGNLGTIIRLADWFGIGEIVCSADSADCYSPKVVQATMGAIVRVRTQYTDLCDYLGRATAAAIPIYGTFLEGANIYKESLTAGGIIVMGNEGAGISAEVAKTITRKLYIPPFPADKLPTSESLNVAIATAVICSEFRRR